MLDPPLKTVFRKFEVIVSIVSAQIFYRLSSINLEYLDPYETYRVVIANEKCLPKLIKAPL